MDFLEIIALAIVQGIAEFLPISSSGHLVVLASLFDQFGAEMKDDKLTVNIVLHLGTLLAILVFYWRRIWQLLGEDRRVIGLLVTGSLPAAGVGLLLRSQCKEAVQNPLLAGAMFLVTAAMLLWSARIRSGTTLCRELSYARALGIGVFQAFAILPGISRSGATIVAGMTCGLKRDEAATFSFLLAIPAIGGAGLLELVELMGRSPESSSPGVLAVGAAVSFAVGLAALGWLVRWLRQGRLHRFAWYLLVLGPVVIVWQLW